MIIIQTEVKIKNKVKEKITSTFSRQISEIATLVQTWYCWRFQDKRAWVYDNIFQDRVPGQSDKEQTVFSVPIDNEKDTGEVEFMLYALNMEF